jgi:glycosyltransferase involved in cell wall biosynthesis
MTTEFEMTMRKQISIDVVIPIFNEAESLRELVTRISQTLGQLSDIEWKVILVENGSTDASPQIISDLQKENPKIYQVRLARNFGMEGGILAGLSVSEADATITMQGDLEDPPELIPQLIEGWRQGFQVVYGEVSNRDSLPRSRRILTAGFYSLGNYLTDGLIRKDGSDYRLISRDIRDFLLNAPDQNLFLRSLVMWPTKKALPIPFSRLSRQSGTSSFRLIPITLFALTGLLNQSIKPLRLITTLGFVAFLCSSMALVILAIRAVLWSVPFAGFGTIVGFQLLFFGILMLAIGVVAEYIAMIFQEVRPRPRFIISEILGLDEHR